MYTHILVAIDGSDTAQQALFEALKLAEGGGHIRVVTVVENPLAGYGTPARTYGYRVVHELLLERGRQLLAKVIRDTQHLEHLSIETHLIDMGSVDSDDIAPAILADSEDYHADVIVMGTHGRSGVKRFLIGSVAERVIRQSMIPVLVVHGVAADPPD
jgi:nucleotide-binding universal stress UspA family protein